MERTVNIFNGCIEEMEKSGYVPSTIRRYRDCLGNFKKYLNRHKINHLCSSDIDQYIRDRVSETGRDATAFKQDLVAIRKLVDYGVRIKHFNENDNFNVSCASSDQFIRLYSKNAWSEIDGHLHEWANKADIGDGVKYQRIMLKYYVQFMSKARPLQSFYADRMKWKQISEKGIEMPDRNMFKLPDGARRILLQWKAVSRFSDENDLVFCNEVGCRSDFILAILNMATGIKFDLLVKIQSSNHNDEVYNRLKSAWETIQEIYTEAFDANKKTYASRMASARFDALRGRAGNGESTDQVMMLTRADGD